jgi:hypothetical protein
MLRTGLLLILCCLPWAPRAFAQDDVVMKAMKDELARTVKQLHLSDLDKPYFVAYRVNDITAYTVAASSGAVTSNQTNHTRLLTVEVRVGDYALDNTNFLSFRFGPAGMFGNTESLPLDDDYKELRRRMWLATDSAFKKALSDLAQKRAAIQNKMGGDKTPDLSKEEPYTSHDHPVTMDVDSNRAQSLVRHLSTVFRAIPEIQKSSVTLEGANEYRRYVNSEGTEYTRAVPYVGLTALASTQADDGTPLTDSVAMFERSLAALPDGDQLTRQVQEMGNRLVALRSAPVVERYNGPVLFEGQASAETFAQAFASKLAASRQMVTDNPQMEMIFARLKSPLQDRLGGRVLPEWAGIADDATATQFDKMKLLGGYAVDADGIKAHRTSLVENGILKALLTSRDPIPGMQHSTGNNGGYGAAPSNLFMTVQNGLTDAALKQKLLSLAQQRGKPYAIIVRHVRPLLVGDPTEIMSSVVSSILPGFGGGSESAAGSSVLAFQVFPDGHETLVRNAQLEGINETSFKDIVAASAKETVYHTPFIDIRGAVLGAFSGSGLTPSRPPLISLVVPDLLFDDVSVHPATGQIPKPPLSAPPTP